PNMKIQRQVEEISQEMEENTRVVIQ
ncbi:MAG: hypothetical protein EZS28_055466, partial [Streblomastix strix]